MRYLIIIAVVLMGCAPKIKTKTPPRATTTEAERILKTKTDIQSKYSSSTEALFALLWPLDFNVEQKTLLSQALKTARDLQSTRKTYTVESTRLKKASQVHQCECVLTGICETEIDPAQQEESMNLCTEVENQQLKNDERLSHLVGLQEKLKESVLNMGGFWLEAPTAPVYDFSTDTIDFNNAQFFNKDGKHFEIKSRDAFWKLDSVAIDGALQAQGELKVHHEGRLYRGELGFQLPERGN